MHFNRFLNRHFLLIMIKTDYLEQPKEFKSAKQSRQNEDVKFF